MEESMKGFFSGFGRILPFEPAEPNEKIGDFKRRVLEQIRVIRLGIKSGDVNDVTISENYAKKAEAFIKTPYFSDKKNKDKKVHNLKKFLKVIVGRDKELIRILKEWIDKKKEFKVIFAEMFFDFPQSEAFDYDISLEAFYENDLQYLSQTMNAEYRSEYILINNLSLLLESKAIMSAIGAKNSWKVATFKNAIIEWNKENPFKANFSFDDVMRLPCFRYKKFLDLTMDKFKEYVEVRREILMSVCMYIDKWYYEISEKSQKAKEDETSKTIAGMLNKYDQFINHYSSIKKEYEKEYSLYRFGQGIIEADIFKNLYK